MTLKNLRFLILQDPRKVWVTIMGIRAKLGRMIEGSMGMQEIPPAKLKKPPKSLA